MLWINLLVTGIAKMIIAESKTYQKRGWRMNYKSVRILLGILAMNLILQTFKEFELFSVAYASSGMQKIALCDEYGRDCAEMGRYASGNRI